ncbi:MAG: four helix bundle protein [Pyrinomonadaceae bacterium]
MAVFKRFEEIKAWQKARELTKHIYQISGGEKFSRNFGLRDQIRRASVSIMANIAEGNGRKTNKDFANFLVISHGSAAEVQSHLYVALDLGYISQENFTPLYQQLDEVSKMTMALAQKLLNT